MDLAFLIDSSGSISGRNWRLLKAFIKDAIDAFDVSPKGTHIASVSYSSRPVVDYRFNTLIGDKLNGPGLHKFVDKIRHQRGFTYIDRALELANKEIFSDKGGMRQAVKKVSPLNNQSPKRTLLRLATVLLQKLGEECEMNRTNLCIVSRLYRITFTCPLGAKMAHRLDGMLNNYEN